MFDMSSDIPNIVAKQGTVEDWIIENRSKELHAFHIHQLHFLLLDYLGSLSTRLSPRHRERALLQRPHACLSERSPAHGFSRSEYRRHVCLSLPSFRARGQGNDGDDSRGATPIKRRSRKLKFAFDITADNYSALSGICIDSRLQYVAIQDLFFVHRKTCR